MYICTLVLVNSAWKLNYVCVEVDNIKMPSYMSVHMQCIPNAQLSYMQMELVSRWYC